MVRAEVERVRDVMPKRCKKLRELFGSASAALPGLARHIAIAGVARSGRRTAIYSALNKIRRPRFKSPEMRMWKNEAKRTLDR